VNAPQSYHSLLSLYVSALLTTCIGTVLALIGYSALMQDQKAWKEETILLASVVLAGALLVLGAIRAWKLVIYAMDASSMSRIIRMLSFSLGFITYCYTIIAIAFVFFLADLGID
jgi:Na+/melibiose symporter-like transporter